MPPISNFTEPVCHTMKDISEFPEDRPGFYKRRHGIDGELKAKRWATENNAAEVWWLPSRKLALCYPAALFTKAIAPEPNDDDEDEARKMRLAYLDKLEAGCHIARAGCKTTQLPHPTSL